MSGRRREHELDRDVHEDVIPVELPLAGWEWRQVYDLLCLHAKKQSDPIYRSVARKVTGWIWHYVPEAFPKRPGNVAKILARISAEKRQRRSTRDVPQ